MAGKIDVLLLLGKGQAARRASPGVGPVGQLSCAVPGVVVDLLELAPVVDGDFLPEEPGRLFHNAARFDFMAGVNSMDGHLFAGVDVPSINTRNETTA